MAADLSTSTMDRPEADSDDEENEDFQRAGKPASTMAQRRRAQKASFEAWLSSDAARQALKSKSKQARLANTADEELSIHSLMAKHDAQVRHNPREYQLELFERAKAENTIAVLDTGSGKTLIAALLLRWIIDQELEDRAAGKLARISFFLVASVTLVYQQHTYLENQLDHKVARVCGADGADNWHKSTWTNIFAANKVIACTAEVLHQCLAHSYITMKQINLLIFDEAHHAKKNHAYARIIKDFYLAETDETFRPRVFGMTASPIDAKTDVVQAASELETLLDSRIATTLDMSLTDAVKKPSESVLYYPALPQPFETSLLQAVKARFGQVEVFDRVLAKAPRIAAHLGPWCADQYLTDAISEKRQRQYELKVERKFHARSFNKDVKLLDNKQDQLRSAVDFIETKRPELMSTEPSASDVSTKVLKLREFLQYQFERPSSHLCIVFVEQRHTARLLSSLFSKIGTRHMRCSYLLGGNAPEIEEDSYTVRQQTLTLMKFRLGDINCLFSTSVAEEGLDVANCNFVIRFDMYSTMIQYVQSRGRAREQNSKFLHMLEYGNSIHQQLLSEVRHQERAMQNFCRALPADRRLVGNEDSLEELLSREKNLRSYVEPSSAAKLTYGNALAYLANFVSAIPNHDDEPLHLTYAVSSRGSKFIAEVLLPGTVIPTRSAIGHVCTKKTLAKRSAAFEACRKLRDTGFLDEHFMPTIERRVKPLMRNAHLAVTNATNQYNMRKKPMIWQHARGELPTELWVTIVDFPDGLERMHRGLAFLTRTRMPPFPSFPVFLNNRQESKVSSRQLPESLRVEENMVRRLSAFTFRMFKDIFSKTYEEDDAQLSYWLAPVQGLLNWNSEMAPQAVIDWALLEEIHNNQEYRWTPNMPHEFLLNKFLVDEFDGSRKFYSVAIDPTLHPQDKLPECVARRSKVKGDGSILDYSISLWKKARERAAGTWNVHQPVMETEKILTRRNMLALPEAKETTNEAKTYLCPEPLRISALPPDVVASCLIWPAIIHRFESYLIALEACDLVGVICSPDVALAAMTKDSDNSGEHEDAEKINFQNGMGENYERLEFIGDTFLKTATTIATFIQFPDADEYEFHVTRMLQLCNNNLFETAKKLKLYEFVRSMAFSRRLWYPEGIKLLAGKGVHKEEETAVVKHSLGSKTIADVCEALIGAAFVTHDRPGEHWKEGHWENAVRAVTKLVGSSGHEMKTWNDYRLAYKKPTYQTGESTASQRDLAEKVALEHPYYFNYPRLLRSAFLHSSQPTMYEKLPNYQRLEFLGDALLDMASITHLFYRFPGKDPQWLTEHKMAMVSNKFLGAVCVEIGFHKHLRYSSMALDPQIREYVAELAEAKRVAGDSRDYWTTVSHPPKCLPDIVESYVGAMFIDSDFDYNVVQDFFDQQIKWYFEDMSIYDTFANNHPCTNLHNLLQTTYGCQDYRLMAKEFKPADGLEVESSEVVAVVMIHNEVMACTKGKSGRYARTRVASHAIDTIKGLMPLEFREKFRCDCHRKSDYDGGGPNTCSDTAMLSADCNI